MPFAKNRYMERFWMRNLEKKSFFGTISKWLMRYLKLKIVKGVTIRVWGICG